MPGITGITSASHLVHASNLAGPLDFGYLLFNDSHVVIVANVRKRESTDEDIVKPLGWYSAAVRL